MNKDTQREYVVLRDLDEPIPEEAFNAAADRSVEAVRDLREEGVEVQWVQSDVRTRADGAVTGTVCRFEAENEDVIHEHAARAALPVTRIDLHGRTLTNEAR